MTYKNQNAGKNIRDFANPDAPAQLIYGERGADPKLVATDKAWPSGKPPGGVIPMAPPEAKAPQKKS